MPSSTSVLLDILEHNFPHKRLDVETHRCYLSNILQVASYCEALKSSILALAIKNILQIDVRLSFSPSFLFVLPRVSHVKTYALWSTTGGDQD